MKEEKKCTSNVINQPIRLTILAMEGDRCIGSSVQIGHFRVVCLVTWPLNASEAGDDLVVIQTSLIFSFKWHLVSIRTTWFTQQKQ